MAAECNKKAETLEEALEEAAQELGVEADVLVYEVIGDDENGSPVEIHAWLEEESVASAEDGEGDEEISEAELDHIADTAIDVLRDILEHFDAQDAEIDEYEGDDGEIILDIVGEDLAVLIGRYGKTLDALQLIVTSIVNRKLGYRYPVVIDVEGYKHRRRQKLESMAKSAAARAVQRKTEVRLRPMTPYERRLVHIALRDDPSVETFSEGEDPNRKIVIRPL